MNHLFKDNTGERYTCYVRENAALTKMVLDGRSKEVNAIDYYPAGLDTGGKGENAIQFFVEAVDEVEMERNKLTLKEAIKNDPTLQRQFEYECKQFHYIPER